MFQVMLNYKNQYVKHAPEFERIFGVRLKPFFDYATGFNVIDFDDKFIKSGNKCMKDIVRKQFGDEAVDLIHKLIGVD